MTNARNQKKHSIGLLLIVMTVAGWLCLPDRFPVSLGPTASAAVTFTVTDAGDDGCPMPLQRNCTLRQVIIAANGNPGLDTIRFNITDGPSPVKTISPLSELPAITDPVIIDGTTQPSYAGQPIIELSGANAGLLASGLTITTTALGSTVTGLVINRFAKDGIHLMVGNGGNIVQGNYIGTDAAGTADLGNALVGIRVRSSNNLIGGTTAAARNVISGNGTGVLINGTAATGNHLQRNYIGANAAGTARLGNSFGISIEAGAADNTIGGPSLGIGNVISGNRQYGILIRHSGSTANKVQGNLIGTDPAGNAALVNDGNGVHITDDAPGSIIGGATDGARNVISGNGLSGILISAAPGTQVLGNFIGTNANGNGPIRNTFSGLEMHQADDNIVERNTIAFNGGNGVSVATGTGNSIRENSIFANNGLGIDLGLDGVTPNDAGDADSGANNLQNFPILTSARYSVGLLTIAGRHDRLPGNYQLQFFSNVSCDASGNGEGESFLMEFSSGGSGGATNFSRTMPVPLPAGRFITATATKLDAANNPTDTSEFSPCIQLLTPGGVQFSSASYSVGEGGGTAAITLNRVGGSDGANTVGFSTSNGTATAEQDYTTTSTTLIFAIGETSKTIFVPITDDSSIESAETVNLRLSLPLPGTPPLGAPSTAVLTIGDNDAAPTPTPTPGSVVHLDSPNYSGSEDCTTVVVTARRVGDTSGVSTVNYATTSGTASERADFTAAIGRLRFNVGETQKSFVVLINEDSLSEGVEMASVTLSNPMNASLSSPSIATLSIIDDALEPPTNANDDSVKFVCQHYHDFLNRQSDAAGQQFWINEIESCGTNLQCRELKRVNVSAAFFLSIEFQQTGYLVYRMYKAAYGNLSGAPVPLTLPEFLPDTQAIGLGVQVGIGDWQAQLEANKQALTNEFVARARFTSAFPSGMTAAQFVDTLNANSDGAVSLAERNQLVNELASGAKTRAQVLRAVAENQTLAWAEFNRAFVLMQYFGYLRRSPNSAPDSDFGGYNFWLGKLNQFGGNFVDAEMVKSFLVSGEYRQRFGP